MAAKPDNSGGPSPWYSFARYAGIGFEVAIVAVGSIFAGAYLDDKYKTTPWFLIIFVTVGFAVIINIILKYSRLARQDMKGDGEESEEDK